MTTQKLINQLEEMTDNYFRANFSNNPNGYEIWRDLAIYLNLSNRSLAQGPDFPSYSVRTPDGKKETWTACDTMGGKWANHGSSYNVHKTELVCLFQKPKPGTEYYVDGVLINRGIKMAALQGGFYGVNHLLNERR